MSGMYYTLKRLYFEGKVDEHGLSLAVKKGWITMEEKDTIIDEKVSE